MVFLIISISLILQVGILGNSTTGSALTIQSQESLNADDLQCSQQMILRLAMMPIAKLPFL